MARGLVVGLIEEVSPVAQGGGIGQILGSMLFGSMLLLVPSAMIEAHSPSEESFDESQLGSAFGGPFMLVDQHGKATKDTDFLGELMIVYFGYSHCPDICPIDTRNIGAAMDLLGDAATRVQPVFITIDPERDTPTRLAEWLGAIHPMFVGLTGTVEQIAEITRSYKVVFERVDTADGYDYTVNHPGLIYVMDADGHFLFLLPPGTGPETIAAEIRAVLSKGD